MTSVASSHSLQDYPSLSLHTHLSSLISFTSDTIREVHMTSVSSSHSLQDYPSLSRKTSVASSELEWDEHILRSMSLQSDTQTDPKSHSLQILSVYVTPHIHLSILIWITSDTIRLCHSTQRRIVSEVNQMRILIRSLECTKTSYPHLIHLNDYESLSLSTWMYPDLIHFRRTSPSEVNEISSLISFTSEWLSEVNEMRLLRSMCCHTQTSVSSSHSIRYYPSLSLQHIHLSSLISFTQILVTSTSVSSSHYSIWSEWDEDTESLSLDQCLISFTSEWQRQYPHLIHFRYYPSLSLTSTSDFSIWSEWDEDTEVDVFDKDG